MASVHHKYRVHRSRVISSDSTSGLLKQDKADLRCLQQAAANQDHLLIQKSTPIRKKSVEATNLEQNKMIHFVLTIVTFGIWGLVWWWLILKSEGKTEQLFRGFDDAYWSYLIEREQPPASLHKMDLDSESNHGSFDA